MDEKKLREYYFERKLTYQECANLLEVSVITIKRWTKAIGIYEKMHDGKARKKRKVVSCLFCQKQFLNYPKQKRKYCNEDCYHKSKLGKKVYGGPIDRSYMQTEAYRKTKRNPDTPEYRRYYNRVQKLTEKVYQLNIKLLNPDNKPRTRCGVLGGYQLDHIKSVKICFSEGISPEECSKLENLQLIPWKENLSKGSS